MSFKQPEASIPEHPMRSGKVPSLQRGLLYKQLEEQLRRQILEGKLSPDQLLPSEKQLCELYSVSRITVRKAMDRLAADGLIYREPGRGTFVAGPTRPNSRLSKSPLIGFVSIGDFTPFALELLCGVEDGARREGFMVLFTSSHYDTQKEAESIINLISRPVIGLVIFPTYDTLGDSPALAQLVSSNFPTVLLDRCVDDLPLDWVSSDNELGGYQAARHLLELGHRRIGFVGSVPISTSANRWQGYRKALEEWGIEPDEALTVDFSRPPNDEAIMLTSGRPQDTSFYSTVRDRLDARRPTGLICFNEYFSILTVAAIQELGLEVGKDISVVGFDRDARRFVPDTPLTIVTQAPFEIGATAIQLLSERIRSRTPLPARHVHLPTQLVVRRSTRRPRDAGDD